MQPNGCFPVPTGPGLAAMLEHTVGLSRLAHGFRGGSWQGGAHGSGGLRGELFGATVGIVGYGAVGRAVATRAAAFGMRVGAISARARPGAPLDWCVTPGEIDRCLGQIDHLVLCCPLTPRTRRLVDRSRMALLKPGAVVINVGRAGLVDETALLAALDAGTVARAVLDVWWRYPAADDPATAPSHSGLHRHPGVIATPHASGWTGAMLERKWRRIADNLIAHLDGRTPAGIVPPPSHG